MNKSEFSRSNREANEQRFLYCAAIVNNFMLTDNKPIIELCQSGREINWLM